VLGLVLKTLRGERRRAGRYSVLLSGQVIAGDAAIKVTIHDLSLAGALVRGDRLPRVGSHVTLVRGDVEIDACLVWKEGNRAGLLFHRRIRSDRLFSLLHESNCSRRAAAPVAL
jgi:hypothetical protein